MRSPARTERQALDRYKEILQLSLSCVTKTVWVIGPPPGGTADERALTTREDPVAIPLGEGLRLNLRASQFFTVSERGGPGEWKVHTEAYAYSAGFQWRDDPEIRFLEWHWHPPRVPQPHIHMVVSHSTLTSINKLHVPTGRVSFESVLRFIISELRVKPIRRDWDTRLTKGEALYKSYRSWA